MKIVDLSKNIEYRKSDPWFMKIKIKHKAHKQSKWVIRFLGLPFKLFPKNFEGWADDTIQNMGVHSATHIDAPWHYSPTTKGVKSKTIDEIPLDWCFASGVVIDMSHKPDFEAITAKEIEEFVTLNKLQIEEKTIVLIRTGRDKHFYEKDFYKQGTGMSADATKWLINRGVKIMGIDSWGWDLPLPYLIEKAKESKNSDLFWEAHLVGQEYEYWHMEQLINLDKLPLSGFKISVFPLKITGASAAPARVVAIFEE